MKKADGIYLPPDTSLFTQASKDSLGKAAPQASGQTGLRQWLESQEQPLSMIVLRQTPARDSKFLLEVSLLRQNNQAQQSSSLIQLVSAQPLGIGSLLQVMFSKGEAQLLQPRTTSEARQQLQLSLNYQILRLTNEQSLLTQTSHKLIQHKTTTQANQPQSTLWLYSALNNVKSTPSPSHNHSTTGSQPLIPSQLTAQLLSANFSSLLNKTDTAKLPPVAPSATTNQLKTVQEFRFIEPSSQQAQGRVPLLAWTKTNSPQPNILAYINSSPSNQPQQATSEQGHSLSRETLQPWLRNSLQGLKDALLWLKQNPKAQASNELQRMLVSSHQGHSALDAEFNQLSTPKLNQWLGQQLSLAAPIHQLDSSIGLLFLPFWHKEHWHELPFYREPSTDNTGQKGWRYRFFLHLPPLAEFCAELELYQDGLNIHFWCQDSRTLNALNQQRELLSQRLAPLQLNLAIDCLFGMPPKPKPGPQNNQGPGQRLDLHI